jgi:hypothetical protein
LRKYTLKRRDLLKSLVVIPAGVAAGCDSARRVTPLLSAEDSFKKLIFAIGPWVAEEKETADNFSSRFLRLKHVRSSFLSENGETIRQLASYFPEGTMALKEVNLGDFSTDQREVLLSLIRQVYDLLEVRFYVSGEPPYGECQTDTIRHTRSPRG